MIGSHSGALLAPGDLHNLVQLGTRPGRATERKLRFMDLAALVAAQLQRMTISLQEVWSVW